MSPRPPRQCRFCGKSYSKKEHYERHLRTHTRERPFSCVQCSTAFARRDALQRHMKSCRAALSARETISVHHNIPTRNAITDAGPDAMPDDSQQSEIFSPMLDSLFAPVSTDFNWQWDDELNLDPSFSMQDLGTYDLSRANPDNPWLPLHSVNASEPAPSASLHPSSQMSRPWFTRVSSPNPAPVPSSAPDSYLTANDNDEVSREVLVGSLQQRVPDTTLPPTDFLNRCIHIFTTRLWPIIPVVHLPTFQPSRTNPLLLLSICSLGALAEGTKTSLYHGERLFEAVQKAILVSFSPKQVSEQNVLALLQASVIGQTFALLSGEPQHLFTAQSFHGTLCVSLRMFYDTLARNDGSLPSSSSDQVATSEWHRWIRDQTIIRLLNAVQIHNGEVSAITQRPASLRVNPEQIPMAAPDNVFLAKSATEWAEAQARCASTQTTRYSIFSRCAQLESFVAEISHSRFPTFHDVAQDVCQIQDALGKWLTNSADSLTTEGGQRLSLLMLWHSCYISLLCNIDSLEQAGGRDGLQISEDKIRDLKQVTQGNDAMRCIAHAMLILNILERLRLSDVPAMHVARAAWHAGLVLAIYSLVGHTSEPGELPDPARITPELDLVSRAELYSDVEWGVVTEKITPTRIKMAAFSLCATLRHLGPWHNAARYGETLDQVLSLIESC